MCPEYTLPFSYFYYLIRSECGCMTHIVYNLCIYLCSWTVAVKAVVIKIVHFSFRELVAASKERQCQRLCAPLYHMWDLGTCQGKLYTAVSLVSATKCCCSWQLFGAAICLPELMQFDRSCWKCLMCSYVDSTVRYKWTYDLLWCGTEEKMIMYNKSKCITSNTLYCRTSSGKSPANTVFCSKCTCGCCW